MLDRIIQLFRQVGRRPLPRPGSVRRVGDQAQVFRNSRWEPLPQHQALDHGEDASSGPPLLAIRCAQPACTDLGPIGTVWSEQDDERGLWATYGGDQPNPSLHRRAVDAARWVRTEHDARHHTETRWMSDHLDAASAADIAAARILTGNPPEQHREPDGT